MEPPETVDSLARRIATMEAFLARQGFQPERPRPIEPMAVMPRADVPSEPIGIAEVIGVAKVDVPVAEVFVAPQTAVPITAPTLPPHPPTMPPPLPRKTWPPAMNATPPLAASVSYASPLPRRAPAATPSSSVEQAIGLKLAGWIGAIILVIGGAMGVKFAYDQGWLGNMPPTFKLGMMYAGALAIVALGEWVYRKVDPRAAVGVYAAGIASLFVVGYAGSVYLNLYGLPTAFGLMAGACAIGAMISLRGKLVSIAVLSHIGANVAPLILHDRAVGELPLFGYLLALQLMAVGLAYLGTGRRWWVLRTLALITTSMWMTIRLVDDGSAYTPLTIDFAGLYAAVFQLELILSALRADERAAKDPSRIHREPTFSLATFSLAITGAFTVALLRWSDQFNSPLQRGGYLIALALLAGIAGAALLHSRGRSMQSLATSWLIQAGLLLVIAIPVLFNGPAVTIAWSALGVAYAVLGVSVKRLRTVFAGAGVWLVAALQLLAAVGTEGNDATLHLPFAIVRGVELPTYLALAVVLGVAGHLIALLAASPRLKSETSQAGSGLSDVMAIAATAAWCVALTAALPPLGATVGLLVVAWALVAIGLTAKHTIYAGGGVAVVVLAMAKWAAVDVLGERLGVDAPNRRFLFNTPMAVGAASAASLLVMLWRGRAAATDTRAVLWKWLALVAVVIAMTIGLSVEVERGAWQYAGSFAWPTMQVVLFGWTILWIAAAHVPALVGRTFDPSRERVSIARNIASVALLLLAAKFLAFDSIAFTIDQERVHTVPGVNLQTALALVITVLLAWSSRRSDCPHPLAAVLRAGIFTVPLAIGSIELDRVFGPKKTLIAWSVFWGAYAITSIIVGFVRRAASFRFAGLGLLGFTLLKIVFVDLASAGTGWRILSFLAVGIVLLLTSVVYGKLSPKLLGTHSVPCPGTPGEG